jgi:phosphoglucomutase
MIGGFYGILTSELGKPITDCVEAHATPEKKSKLSSISAGQLKALQMAGEKIEGVIDHHFFDSGRFWSPR